MRDKPCSYRVGVFQMKMMSASHGRDRYAGYKRSTRAHQGIGQIRRGGLSQ